MHPMPACDHRYTLQRHLLIFVVRRVRKNATVKKGSVDVSDLGETAKASLQESVPKQNQTKNHNRKQCYIEKTVQTIIILII